MSNMGFFSCITTFATLLAIAFCQSASANDNPSRQATTNALRKATTFFHQRVAIHGGYLWQYSGDLKLRSGEGIVGPTTVWVQPPGTPAVGAAFLQGVPRDR